MLARADRILVRLPSWLGDLVAVEPAVRALAEHRGAADGDGLTLALPQHLAPLLDGWLPGAQRIAHAGRGGERASDWRGHDVALLLTGSFRSAWTAARAGIPRRVGQARDARGWLLTDGASPALERGRVPLGRAVRGRWPRYLPRPVATTAAELVGLCGVPVRDTVPRLAALDDVGRAVDARLAAAGVAAGERPIVANVGGRPDSAKALAPKQWIAALTAAAGELESAPLVLVAGPGEERAARAVADGVAAAGRRALVAWDDRAADLPELLALCARASVVVTTDAGPRHVARAAGAPTVVLFGPTDPRHSACPGAPETWLRVPVDCGPCHRERCPLDGAARGHCLSDIAPALVGSSIAARSRGPA